MKRFTRNYLIIAGLTWFTLTLIYFLNVIEILSKR